jgi:hypothetical protein
MCTEQVELNYWDWVARLTEKMTFVRLKVADHKEISDDDYYLLECLHKLYFNGDYPLYQTKLDLTEEKAVSQGLFDNLADNTSDVSLGTDFVSTSTN